MTSAARARLGVLCLASAVLIVALGAGRWATGQGQPTGEVGARAELDERAAAAVEVAYLEIVTPEVSKTCETLAKMHGVTFGEPVPALGNARTAALAGGGRIGVRAPMSDNETPVVRPYVLVQDINAAVKAAEEAGAEVAIARMEIPGEGIIAIYFLAGIEHGLWER